MRNGFNTRARVLKITSFRLFSKFLLKMCVLGMLMLRGRHLSD